MTAGLQVISPVALPPAGAAGTAARPASLEGGVLAVLVNGKEYSEVVLRRVASRLQERYRFADVVWWNKRFPSKPAPFIDDMVQQGGMVLNGVGH